MSTLPLDRPVPRHLDLPPIDRLPSRSPHRPEPDALGEFVATTRPWGRIQVPLSIPVTCALWVMLATAGAHSAWLIAVLAGRAACSSVVCSITTLGNPGLLLILAGSCVATLLAAATVTGDLTRAGAPGLAAIVVAAVAGTVSLLGVMALLALVVVAVTVVVSVLAFVADRV